MSRFPAAIYLTTEQLKVGDFLVKEGTLKAKKPHHDGTYYDLSFAGPYKDHPDRSFSTPAGTLWLVRT